MKALCNVIEADGKMNVKEIDYVRTTDGKVYRSNGKSQIVASDAPECVLAVLGPMPLRGRDGKPAFSLHPDGRVEANWHELMAMKDEFLKQPKGGEWPPLANAWAAALWLARNTR